MMPTGGQIRIEGLGAPIILGSAGGAQHNIHIRWEAPEDAENLVLDTSVTRYG
jgi:hypothetical protein